MKTGMSNVKNITEEQKAIVKHLLEVEKLKLVKLLENVTFTGNL